MPRRGRLLQSLPELHDAAAANRGGRIRSVRHRLPIRPRRSSRLDASRLGGRRARGRRASKLAFARDGRTAGLPPTRPVQAGDGKIKHEPDGDDGHRSTARSAASPRAVPPASTSRAQAQSAPTGAIVVDSAGTCQAHSWPAADDGKAPPRGQDSISTFAAETDLGLQVARIPGCAACTGYVPRIEAVLRLGYLEDPAETAAGPTYRRGFCKYPADKA
ncbi:hypothetical protein CDD83_8311 [Cordyceps sp. RAO-2017]|nr:hypothetical protein CDD83_8311 [Cordyceps sp. RAO-2017]